MAVKRTKAKATLSFHPQVLHDMKVAAAVNDKTVSDLLVTAFEEWIERRKELRISEVRAEYSA